MKPTTRPHSTPRFDHRHTMGFSFMELLVVFAIIGVVAAIGAVGFRNFVHHESLEAAASDMYTTLSDARSATLASEYGEQYGVHIETDRIIRFRGATYNPSSTLNQTIDFRGVRVEAALTGGPTVLFERQTGTTTNSGTITLIHKISLAEKTITLFTSGIVSSP